MKSEWWSILGAGGLEGFGKNKTWRVRESEWKFYHKPTRARKTEIRGTKWLAPSVAQNKFGARPFFPLLYQFQW